MVKEYLASFGVSSRSLQRSSVYWNIGIDFFPLAVLESSISVGKMAYQTQEKESDENLLLRYFSVLSF